MEECMDSLGYKTVFSTLDEHFGYWKVEIDATGLDKTTFTSHHVFYLIIYTKIGLNNSPGTLGRLIYFLISTEQCQYEMVYFDDIVALSKSVDEHITHF